ncbi:MAG: response regulator [Lentisphaeraceae bacterium]|nr:response regulator [Lentisphaeraceae bacterium]
MNLKIVVIDNDDSLRESTVEFLKSVGFSVTGVRCIKYAASFLDNSFDLVITNIVMPEMDGNELLIYLKNNNLDIKVIAMSDRGLKRSKIYFDVAKALGAQSCLHKPFTEDQLLNEIEGVFQADLMVC